MRHSRIKEKANLISQTGPLFMPGAPFLTSLREACPERSRRVGVFLRRSPYLRPRRTALRKTSQASLHFSNRDRFPRLSGYSINDFNSSTTRTGITYPAFIGRA